MNETSVLPLVEDVLLVEPDVVAPDPHEGRASPPRRRLGALHVERVEIGALIGYHSAWADLCARALEPNIFLEPAFALPLLQHVLYPRRPSFVLVWEESGPTSFGRLLGLFPLEMTSLPMAWDGIARGFAHKQTSCGIPLVDRANAAQAIDAMLHWLAEQETRPVDAVVFQGVAKEGLFYRELGRVCTQSSRRLAVLGEHRRAVLRRPDEGQRGTICFASAKRRKERARQFRRLSEAGARTYVTASAPGDIAAATERFLALEHNGWKGERGTALLADRTLATFTRTMTRLMAHEGKCRIDSIEINGKPVAMGIVLKAKERAYFWKTAFDEAYAPLSPGVQFAIELTQAQLADATIASTDSCAIANHPMIDRLWPDRMTVIDLMLEVAPGSARRFARSLRIERYRRAIRQRAKSLWLRLRHRGA